MSENPVPYGNPKEKPQTFTYNELTYSNYLTLEALFRVLERKGIVTQKEVLEEIQKVQVEDKELKDKLNKTSEG